MLVRFLRGLLALALVVPWAAQADAVRWVEIQGMLDDGGTYLFSEQPYYLFSATYFEAGDTAQTLSFTFINDIDAVGALVNIAVYQLDGIFEDGITIGWEGGESAFCPSTDTCVYQEARIRLTEGEEATLTVSWTQPILFSSFPTLAMDLSIFALTPVPLPAPLFLLAGALLTLLGVSRNKS